MRGRQKHGTAAPPDMPGLQIGTWEYLKNFRRGLRWQQDRAARELAEAQEAAEAVPLQEAQRLATPMEPLLLARRVEWLALQLVLGPLQP